jgi:hypothetical protein
MPTDTPIACQLGVFSADEQRRYQMVRTEIDAAITRIVETDNGYEFHVPGDDTMLVLATELRSPMVTPSALLLHKRS